MAVDDFVGFGIRGYRSYGGELQIVGPMSKVHLIAGKNNVGKSNLLRALKIIVAHMSVSRQLHVSNIFPAERDTPEGWSVGDLRNIAIAFTLTRNVLELFRIDPEQSGPSLLRLFETDAFSRGYQDTVWLEFDVRVDPSSNSVTVVPSREQIEAGMSQATVINELWFTNLTLQHRTQSGGLYDNWTALVQQWDPWSLIPKFEWIDAKRSVGAADSVRAGDSSGEGFRHGRGFIPELLALQNPETVNHRRDRPKFDAFQDLVQAVLEDPSARVSVSGSASDLQITTHGRFESYKDLGTGLTEVVHIAAMATSVSGYIISIEEPEIHLHPTLQRLLVTYLAEKTDNHYVVSTHSASMLDAEVASISHVHADSDGWSIVQPVALRRDRASVVADLGNRASDLVQSNYVIWVEGPSDRIYLSAWLRERDPNLIEGVNFSIMFYGGGLLNHLTAKDDDEVTNFIELVQINRNFAIVIDSDISKAGQSINATKKRVVEELSEAGGIAWVTDGYTIENYVPSDVISVAIDEAYPEKSYTVPSGQLVSPLGKEFDGEKVKPNKVTVARRVVATSSSFESWDENLSLHINRLIEAIRRANGLA